MRAMRRRLPVAASLVLALLVLASGPGRVEAHKGPRPGIADGPSAPAPVSAAAAAGPRAALDAISFEPAVRAWSAAATAPAAPTALILLAALALLTLAHRPRQGFALTLVLVLACFAFESGVHSVHHLGEPRPLTQCSVAVASHQVSGTGVDLLAIDRTPADAGLLLATGLSTAQPSRLPSPHEGRAPPSLV
jgi:hypothetical protein